MYLNTQVQQLNINIYWHLFECAFLLSIDHSIQVSFTTWLQLLSFPSYMYRIFWHLLQHWFCLKTNLIVGFNCYIWFITCMVPRWKLIGLSVSLQGYSNSIDSGFKFSIWFKIKATKTLTAKETFCFISKVDVTKHKDFP